MASLRPRPGILEIEPYVGGKSELAGAARVIKLSANESAIGPSPKAVAACQAVAAQIHRYPDGDMAALRAAIGRRFQLDPAQILCGAGSDELIQLLLRAYAGPGDEVLYSAHGFLMYKLGALAVGAVPVAAPERRLTTDVDALLARLNSRTRMVFIANPNNPTGSYLSADELARLHAGLPEDVLLVIDAAYAEYVRRNDYTAGIELVDRAANVVMTRTFSKLFGLAALRLGWLYAPPHVIDVLQRLRGPFNVSTAGSGRGHRRARGPGPSGALARPQRPLAAMVGRGAGRPRPEGASEHRQLRPGRIRHRRPSKSAIAASVWLERDGIIARAMGAYGLPQCLRLSIGLEAENRAVVRSLSEFVA